MKKKLVFPLVLALFASLLFSSLAFAQASQPQRTRHSGRRGVGQVTSIDGDRFTITSRDGASYSVLVNDATHFRQEDGSEASFDDLRVSQWVIVIAAPISSQTTVDQPKFTASWRPGNPSASGCH